MKSRTLISFCQSPPWKPCQGDLSDREAVSTDGVAGMAILLEEVVPLAASVSRCQQSSGMSGDHQLLVRRNHPRRYPARRSRDARGPGGVGGVVELDAEPRARFADTAADY